MIKNKRLAVCLVIFAFLVVIVVLTSTVFALKEVSVEFLSTTDKLSGQQDIVIESANFSYGESTLFLNKQKYIDRIEKNNPYIKIVNIQSVFPNRLVVNAVERVEVYAIKVNNTYLFCDEDFKVLRQNDNFVNSSTNAILLDGLANISNTAVGDFLSFNESQKQIMQLTFNSLREYDLSYVNLKAKIKSITISYENDNDVKVSMRSGVEIGVKNANMQNSDKFNLAFSTYEHNVNYQTSGIIEIRTVNTEQGKVIKAFYLSESE